MRGTNGKFWCGFFFFPPRECFVTLLIYGFCLGFAVKDIFFSSLYFSLTAEDLTEKAAIEKSAECCRKILNHVNEEVKVMENLLVRNAQFTTQPTAVW